MRSGFSVIAAAIIVSIIAVVGAMILSVSSTSSKRATDDYLRIQAEMLARSATEFAVMRLQGFKSINGDCLEKLDINATPFDVNVTIGYVLTEPKSGCNTVLGVGAIDGNSTIIDVVVKEQVSGNPANEFDPQSISKEPITVHKRTVQKY